MQKQEAILPTFEKPVDITLSLCDYSARLGIPNTFGIFMDLAAQHAELLGLGAKAMNEKGLFWLTVRTRVIFHKRPALTANITARTWPGKPESRRCTRYYSLSSGDTLLAEGKTDWAVLDIATGKLSPTSAVYPEGLCFNESIVCPTPFGHISTDFSPEHKIGEYKVVSTDIDLGGHMNNVAYVHMLFGFFNCEELRSNKPREVEISYRSPCYEGEILSIYKREAEQGIELGVFGGEVCRALAKISY